MLKAVHTPNMTGVLLSAEPEDFRILYDSLHKLLDRAGEDITDGPVIRILGFCYELRHTFIGHRNASFKEHGLNDEQLAFLSLVGPKQNLILSFEMFWPEMLYVIFSLESFINEYQKNIKLLLGIHILRRLACCSLLFINWWKRPLHQGNSQALKNGLPKMNPNTFCSRNILIT